MADHSPSKPEVNFRRDALVEGRTVRQREGGWELDNLRDPIEPLVEDFVDRIAEEDCVEGVVLLGGLGLRNYIDEYSDLDLAVFVDDRIRPKSSRLPPFAFTVSHAGRSYEFNVYQHLTTDFAREELDEEGIAAYLDCIVAWDRDGRIQGLLTEKLERSIVAADAKRRDRMIWLLDQFRWRVLTNAPRAMARGLPESAHDLVSKGVDMLVELAYLIEAEPRPHLKWRFDGMLGFECLSSRCVDLFRQMMTLPDLGQGALQTRVSAATELYSQLLAECREKFALPDDLYEYCSVHIHHRQLSARPAARVAAEEFCKVASRADVAAWEGYAAFYLLSTAEELRAHLERADHELVERPDKAKA